MTIEVGVEGHGSIVLIRPANGETEKVLRALTGPSAQWFGGALAVEPRYVQGLLDALAGGEGGDDE